MEPMIKNELESLWRKKELEWGRIVTVQEVAKATGLNWETVDNLKSGRTARYDATVVARICQFFDVPEGEPIPFLIYSTQAA